MRTYDIRHTKAFYCTAKLL